MSEEKQQEQEKPTPEQVKAYKESMKKFYEDQIPYLKKVKEYETLLADIEEQRAKRTEMSMRIAHMMTPPSQEPTAEEKAEFEKARLDAEAMRKEQSAETVTDRKLKKVE